MDDINLTGVGWSNPEAPSEKFPVFVLDTTIAMNGHGTNWDIEKISTIGKIAIASTTVVELITGSKNETEFKARQGAAKRLFKFGSMVLPQVSKYQDWIWGFITKSELAQDALAFFERLKRFQDYRNFTQFSLDLDFSNLRDVRNEGYEIWARDIDTSKENFSKIIQKLLPEFDFKDRNDKKSLKKLMTIINDSPEFYAEVLLASLESCHPNRRREDLKMEKGNRIPIAKNYLNVFLRTYGLYLFCILFDLEEKQKNDRGDLDIIKFSGMNLPFIYPTKWTVLTLDNKWLRISEKDLTGLFPFIRNPEMLNGVQP